MASVRDPSHQLFAPFGMLLSGFTKPAAGPAVRHGAWGYDEARDLIIKEGQRVLCRLQLTIAKDQGNQRPPRLGAGPVLAPPARPPPPALALRAAGVMGRSLEGLCPPLFDSAVLR